MATNMYEYFENLPSEAKKRYQEKLELIGSECCPYKFPADRWSDDPTEWPALSYHNLYHYLIKSPRIYSPEAMENYKSLDAFTYFRAGWVQTVTHIRLKGDVILLCADVRPSYRTTDEPHKPWIALKVNGSVIAGHCNCMAGLGETCSHVGAILYKVEAAVRIGMTSTVPTELPCVWNQTFVRNVVGCPVAEVNLYTDKAKQNLVSPPGYTKVKNVSHNSKMTFLREIHSVQPKTVALHLFPEFSDSFICKEQHLTKLPPNLQSLKNTDLSLMEEDGHLMSKISLTDAEIVYVEEATRNQHHSVAWFDQRAGRITGSVISDVCHASLEKENISLIKKICVVNSRQLNIPALMWGREHESHGIELYKNVSCGLPYSEKLLNNAVKHDNLNVETIGLCVLKQKPWYGASPDAAVLCACCGYGVLEIKCPYSLRDQSLIEEIEKGRFYICKDLNDKFYLRRDYKYFFQVQHEMSTTETSYCDLVVWTPSEAIILRIERDKTFIEQMYEKADKFWKKFILHELCMPTLNVQNKKAESECDRDQPTVRYCIEHCEKPGETNDMVGCDSCNNWFHPVCIGLKRLPKSKTWYCKSCKNKK